jgi:hypothetical protein
VPADLLDGINIVLEQVTHLGPLVEQSTGPCPRDQANAGLDTARPVHSGEKGVRTPPGPQLIGCGLGVALVLGKPPGRGQHCDVMMPGHFPDLLDVAGFRLIPVMDAEGQLTIGGATSRHRIMEPVRVRAVDTWGT